jgi:cytoplasmic iron level regulating protein YaaA (DUF328/UPF0246 family)
MRPPPLVLLAPSEGKAAGGEPGRLHENPAQAWVRRRLQALARKGTLAELGKAFGLKEPALQAARAEALALDQEVPLLPALERYTGVAFQGLSPKSLDGSHWSCVWILSPLRGLERGDAPVPPYKLKLGSLPGLREHWRKQLPGLLEGIPDGTLWDLLPADHSQLLRDCRRPRHSLEIRSARGVTVSHAAKLFRGRVAGWILRQRPADPAKVLRGRIEGGTWAGMQENETGGVKLLLEVP